MASKTSQKIADITFVIEECVRLAELGKSNFRQISKNDLHFDLPSPSGGGFRIFCGQAAYDRLCRLAEEASRREGLERRIELWTVLEPLKQLFVERFIRDQKPVSQPNVDKFIRDAGRLAREKCLTKKHLIPCHLVWEQGPDEIRIGPVTFHSRQNFRNRIARGAKEYLSSSAGVEGERAFKRKLLSDALYYFRAFKWIAEVTIESCDEQKSSELAERVVTSALDCLHLLFGASYSDSMRIGGPRLERDQRARLELSEDEDLIVSISSAGIGQIGFNTDWAEILLKEEQKSFLDLAGIALEVVTNPDIEKPLSRRFLEAAQWYGEAVRESSAAAKVIKYVTALERAIVTEDSSDITKPIANRVAERVAALCLDEPTTYCLNHWRSQAKKVYDLRSKLVHGSMSPGNSKVSSGVLLGAKLGRATLIGFINLCGEKGLRQTAITNKNLEKWFEGLVAHSVKITKDS